MSFLSSLFGSGPGKEVTRILNELAALPEDSEEERKGLRQQLVDMGVDTIDPLDRWLARAPKVQAAAWMMQDVCDVLAALGEEALMPLAHHARSDPPSRRAAALIGLGKTGRVEAVPVCIEAIRNGDAEVVAAACAAVKRIGSPDSVDDLAALVADPGIDAKVRAAVVSAVASIKSPKATRVVVEAAKDPALAPSIPGCIAAIGPLAVPALVDGLGSSDPGVRKAMIQSLVAIGPIGGDESVQGLARALKDQDADVRGLAASALQQIGRFEPLVESLREENFDNRFVVQALARMGKDRDLMQAYANLLESLGRRVTPGSIFAVEKLREANHLTTALRYLEEVTQYLPEDSNYLEPAIRLKREVQAQLQSRTSRK